MDKNHMTLNIYINAWLDCTHPYISIHNKHDDDLMAYFNSGEVNQLLRDGEIDIHELQSTDSQVHIDIITTLLAISSKKKIKHQLAKLGNSLGKRKFKKTNLTNSHEQAQQVENIYDFPSPFVQPI